jgi:hypothetical protein
VNICPHATTRCSINNCVHAFPHSPDGRVSATLQYTADCGHTRFRCPLGVVKKLIRCRRWKPNNRQRYRLLFCRKTFIVSGPVEDDCLRMILKAFGRPAGRKGVSLPNEYLPMFQMGLSVPPVCTFCHSAGETVEKRMGTPPQAQVLWKEEFGWVCTVCLQLRRQS